MDKLWSISLLFFTGKHVQLETLSIHGILLFATPESFKSDVFFFNCQRNLTSEYGNDDFFR